MLLKNYDSLMICIKINKDNCIYNTTHLSFFSLTRLVSIIFIRFIDRIKKKRKTKKYSSFLFNN